MNPAPRQRTELAIVPVETTPHALALVPNSLDGAMQLARWLASSTFLPEALRGKEGDIFAIMLAGAELGLPPMATLRGVYIVNGKPALEGKTKSAICLQRGAAEYFRKVEDTPQAVTWETRRKGDTEPRKSRYTLAEAKAAGLLEKKGPWQTFPQRMLGHRALGWLCDDAYPDIVLGVATAEDFDPAEMSFSPIGGGVDIAMLPRATAATAAPLPVQPAAVDASSAAAAPEPMTEDDVLTIEARISEATSKESLKEIARVDITGAKRQPTIAQRDRLLAAYSSQIKWLQ